MVNQAQAWLNNLATKIDTLAAQIKQQRLQNKIFHERLFGPYPINLVEACQYCRDTLDHLQGALGRHKSEALVQYYCEQLNDQLSSLYNATQQASSDLSPSVGKQSIQVQKLREKLDQHREYERKLSHRVKQCQQAVSNARSEQFRQQWLNWLETEKSRLTKCQEAVAVIEAQLTEAQRQNNH